jgi:peptidoglycan hydrolase-like protein with peptidoglycan-binding domain
LLNNEFWTRVHARQQEINRMASEEENYFPGIFGDILGESSEAEGSVILEEITEKESLKEIDLDTLKTIKKAQRIKDKLSGKEEDEEEEEIQKKNISSLLHAINKETKSEYRVSNKQVTATMFVIKEEYEKLADELESELDMDELDYWDGTTGLTWKRTKTWVKDWIPGFDEPSKEELRASRGPAIIFDSEFLPSLAILYDNWLHAQLKQALKEKIRPPGPVPTPVPTPGPTPGPAPVPRQKTKAEKQADLLKGMGLDLSAIQEMLYVAGYFDETSDNLRTFGFSSRKPLKADNKYGPETEAAIMNLQKNLNSKGSSLKVDGLYGPATHEAYKKNPINADGSLPGEKSAKKTPSKRVEIFKTSKVKRGGKFHVTVTTTDGKEFKEIGDNLNLTNAAARDKAEAYIKTLPLQERRMANIYKILSRKAPMSE